MSKSLAVAVEEIEDGIDDPTDAWNDWTPRENRILARSLKVETSIGSVTLWETDRNDPTRIRLYLTTKNHRNGAREIDAELTATQLDELVQAFTLARDAAVAEWMLEPART
jgi:hypothetical protein